jgi:hypothetical protein
MVKRFLKSVFAISFVILLVLMSSLIASAEVPFNSYTYWTDVGEENKAVYNRPMYTAEANFNAL